MAAVYPAGPDPMMIRSRIPSCSAGGMAGCAGSVDTAGPGVGVLYDLGVEQTLAGVTITTTLPGATVEVRTGGAADGDLDAFPVATSGELTGTDDLAFASPVSARYVLVWVTGLVDSGEGFSADLAEVGITTAGQ